MTERGGWRIFQKLEIGHKSENCAGDSPRKSVVCCQKRVRFWIQTIGLKLLVNILRKLNAAIATPSSSCCLGGVLPVCMDEISSQEPIIAAKSLKKKTSSGHDGLPAKFWSSCHQMLTKYCSNTPRMICSEFHTRLVSECLASMGKSPYAVQDSAIKTDNVVETCSRFTSGRRRVTCVFQSDSFELPGVQGSRRRGRPRKRWAVEVYRFVKSMADYDPELCGPGPQRLLVLRGGGRWNSEVRIFLHTLVRLRSLRQLPCAGAQPAGGRGAGGASWPWPCNKLWARPRLAKPGPQPRLGPPGTQTGSCSAKKTWIKKPPFHLRWIFHRHMDVGRHGRMTRQAATHWLVELPGSAS